MGRVIPQHSYDHTRRSQRDIVVYNDLELRNVLGNVKRGSRVVIASKIAVTRTVEIKLVDDNSNIDSSQGVIISGFGTGRLVPKEGTLTAFDLFRIRIPETTKSTKPIPVSVQHLNFSGFNKVITVEPSGSSRTLSKFSVIGCIVEDCATLIGTNNPSAYPASTFLQQCEVTDNILSPNSSGDASVAAALSLDVHYVDCVLSGNIMKDPSPSFASIPESMTGGIQRTAFSNNIINGEVDIFFDQSSITGCTFKEKVKLDGSLVPGVSVSQGTISNNKFIRILYDALEIDQLTRTTITGNQINGLINNASCHQLTIVGNQLNDFAGNNLLPNSQNYILRENFSNASPGGLENQHKPVFGAGRISTGGEVLAQQVIESTTNYFECVVVESSNPALPATQPDWQQLKNDLGANEKVTVQFYVPEGTRNPTIPPEGKTVLIRLKAFVRNAGPSNEMITIRITNQDSDTANTLPVTVHKPQTFLIAQNVGNGAWEPMVFEWLIEPGLFWDVGQQVQIWFQVNTDQNGAGPSLAFVAGHYQDYIPQTQPAIDYGPMITSAIAVPQNLVTVSASAALKKGKPLSRKLKFSEPKLKKEKP